MRKTPKEITEMPNNTFLYRDEATHTVFKNREETVLKTFDKLKDIVVSTIGDDIKINYKQLAENPIEYITELYFLTWGFKSYPPNADRKNVFANATRIPISTISNLKAKLDTQLRDMQKYAPVFHADKIATNVSPNYFDCYLDSKKADEYNALKSFLDSAKELRKYGSDMPIHLLRYGNHLEMNNNGEVIIDLNYFKC